MDNSTNYNSRLKSSLNINSYGKVHALKDVTFMQTRFMLTGTTQNT